MYYIDVVKKFVRVDDKVFDELGKIFLLEISNIKFKKEYYHINLKEACSVKTFLKTFFGFCTDRDFQIMGFELCHDNDIIIKSKNITLKISKAPLWLKLFFSFKIKNFKKDDNTITIDLFELEESSNIVSNILKILGKNMDLSMDNNMVCKIIIEKKNDSIYIKLGKFVLVIIKDS